MISESGTPSLLSHCSSMEDTLLGVLAIPLLLSIFKCRCMSLYCRANALTTKDPAISSKLIDVESTLSLWPQPICVNSTWHCSLSQQGRASSVLVQSFPSRSTIVSVSSTRAVHGGLKPHLPCGLSVGITACMVAIMRPINSDELFSQLGQNIMIRMPCGLTKLDE